MRRLLISILTLIVLSAVASCSDDDGGEVPSYRSDLLFAVTNSDTLVSHLMLDDGRQFNVSSQRIKAAAANSRLRCYATFEIGADSTDVRIYEIKRISCYTPLPADSFDVHPQDPVNVTSVWRSGNYVNLCVAPLLSAIKDFRYDFCIDSITDRHGSVVLHSALLYQKPAQGGEYYTQPFYHTIPLRSNDYPCEFDSLYIYINTYDGIKTFAFAR